MKINNRKNTKTMVFLLKVIIVLIALFLCVDKIETKAAKAPYNDADSTNGVRIDGWDVLQQMTTFGHNTDNGCGFTAMAVLLQFYNDYTIRSGEILPDNFNYNLDTGTFENNVRANALRQDLKERTPRFIGGLGYDIDRWFNLSV